MKSILLFVSLLASAFTHDCLFSSPDGNIYDLSSLERFPGQEPYKFTTKANGDPEYEFNVCGSLDGLGFQFYPKNASVVYYETPSTIHNYGKRPSLASLSRGRIGVEIVYGEGEKCLNTQRKTSFEFLCDEIINGFLTVEGIEKVDECYSVFTIRTGAACPITEQFPGETSVEVESPSFGPILIFAILISCLVCLCACCCRRRGRKNCQKKRMNGEHEMVQLNNDVSFQQVPLEDYYRQNNVQQSNGQVMPMQYLNAPQYFLYPSVQTPVQHSPATLESDEDLAKRLQAQFDSENNV